MTDLYFILPLLFPAAWFLGVPWLLRSTIVLNGRPTMLGVAPENLTDPLRRAFAISFDHLTAFGFEFVGVRKIVNQMPGNVAHLAVFVHPETAESAATMVIENSSAGVPPRFETTTELVTVYADGTAVDTSDTTQFGSFPEPDGTTKSYLPHLEGLADLIRAHRVICRAVGGSTPGFELRDEHQGDLDRLLSTSMARETSRAVAAGLFKPKPGWSPGADRLATISDNDAMSPYAPPGRAASTRSAPAGSDDDWHVMTVYGMYLMTWHQLPPIRQIRNALRFRRDRRRLRRLAEATGMELPGFRR